MSTEPQKKKRALVIGAGASGLVMLKELLSTGAFDVVAFVRFFCCCCSISNPHKKRHDKQT